MARIPAGTEVAYTITYMDMTAPPAPPAPPALPEGLALVREEAPTTGMFLALYDAVGRPYEWQDRFEQADADPDALDGYVTHPRVLLWRLLRGDAVQGFFQLDHRAPSVCDLAYFGLLPGAVGGGLGRVFLMQALCRAWALPGVERVTVNTCTLDHPRALALYRSVGFRPIGTEDRRRILKYDRDTDAVTA